MKAAEKHVADNFALAKAAERSGDQERARYYRARNEKWQYETRKRRPRRSAKLTKKQQQRTRQ